MWNKNSTDYEARVVLQDVSKPHHLQEPIFLSISSDTKASTNCSNTFGPDQKCIKSIFRLDNGITF